MVPARSVFCQLIPADAAYWTDQPVTSTALAPRLNNSMKSFLNVAPLLPPPPYTWLMTISGDTACACCVSQAGDRNISITTTSNVEQCLFISLSFQRLLRPDPECRVPLVRARGRGNLHE